MASNYYPSGNAEFLVWLDNFINVATTSKTALGITTEQLAELTTMRDNLAAKVSDKAAKIEAARAATTGTSAVRRGVNEKVGFYNKILKVNKTIDPALLTALGLSLNGEGGTPVTPFALTDLVVEGRSNGINYLRFKRGGNKSSVNFIVEAKIGAATEFGFLSVTKKTRFEHKNQTPGVRAVYRVKAVRGDSESTYSNDAVVYNNG
jgi:hypothetical protein